jgi:hypothetical protein
LALKFAKGAGEILGDTGFLGDNEGFCHTKRRFGRGRSEAAEVAMKAR